MFSTEEIAEVYQEALIPAIPLDLSSKTIDTRLDRPDWAGSEQSIALHIMGARRLRQARIAHMFWYRNITAREIAEELGDSVSSVESVLKRLRK